MSKNLLELDNNMMQYLRVYRQLLYMNFMVLVIYRSNFINSMLATVGWGLFSLYSVVILTAKTTEIFGWSRNELLLLNGYYGLIIGVFHVLLSRNLERFSSVIHNGQLDSILIKPMDSQFMLSLWMVNYTSLARIIIAGWYVWYMGGVLHIQLTLLSAIEFIALSITSLILLYAIWYTVVSCTIWFTKLSNVVELMYNITGMARYPQEMYTQLAWYLFAFILPLTLLITTPAKIYLGHGSLWDIFQLVCFSTIFFVLSRKFWKFALRYYTSAS